MERPHLRPRIALRVPQSPAELEARLTARLASMPELEGRVRRRAVLVWIAAGQRRWWSPCLELAVDPDGPGATQITGHLSAHPRLMTASTFIGIFFTFLGCLSATWSLVQVTMDEAPRCLLGTLGSGAALLALFGAHRLAQRWAATQTRTLTALVEGLDDPAQSDASYVRHVL